MHERRTTFCEKQNLMWFLSRTRTALTWWTLRPLQPLVYRIRSVYELPTSYVPSKTYAEDS